MTRAMLSRNFSPSGQFLTRTHLLLAQASINYVHFPNLLLVINTDTRLLGLIQPHTGWGLSPVPILHSAVHMSAD